MRIPEQEERQEDRGIVKEITAENSPNLMKNKNWCLLKGKTNRSGCMRQLNQATGHFWHFWHRKSKSLIEENALWMKIQWEVSGVVGLKAPHTKYPPDNERKRQRETRASIHGPALSLPSYLFCSCELLFLGSSPLLTARLPHASCRPPPTTAKSPGWGAATVID